MKVLIWRKITKWTSKSKRFWILSFADFNLFMNSKLHWLNFLCVFYKGYHLFCDPFVKSANLRVQYIWNDFLNEPVCEDYFGNFWAHFFKQNQHLCLFSTEPYNCMGFQSNLNLWKDTVTLGSFSWNLSRDLVALLQHKLHRSLPSITYPEKNMSLNVFVTLTVAQSGTNFYFSQ